MATCARGKFAADFAKIPRSARVPETTPSVLGHDNLPTGATHFSYRANWCHPFFLPTGTNWYQLGPPSFYTLFAWFLPPMR